MTSVAEYKKRMLFKRKLKENPLGAMESMGGMNDILFKAFKQAAEELVQSKEFIQSVATIALSYIPLPRDGKPGGRGEPGKTPLKGIDYYTEAEKNELIESVRPVLGKDYFTDGDILAIVQMAKERAKPIAGVDYPLPKDGKDGTEVKGEDIVKKINNLPLDKDKMIDAKHIKGLIEEKMKGTEMFRGGLKMRYGTELEGIINGVNTVFTLPASAPRPKDGKFIVSARGVLKNSDSGDFTVSADNRTIIFTSAPPTGSGRPRIELYEAH